MRLAFSSLILAAGLASAAYAQAPTQVPAAEAAQPGATPPAPADQVTPAPTTPVTAQPAPPAAAAPAPAPEAAPAPPPPSLPTTGDGAALISIIERVCVPAVRGQELAPLAKAAGMRQNRRDGTWTAGLEGNRAYQIVLFPQGANQDACFGEIRFAHGQDEPITQALNIWAFLHELDPTANYTQPQDPDGLKRVRRSWEKLSSDQSVGLNISTVRKPDDTPVNRRYDLATFMYQERKL